MNDIADMARLLTTFSLAFVCLSALLAAGLRFGPSTLIDAIRAIFTPITKRFDDKAVRPRIAAQIQIFERDGLIRGELNPVGDAEFDRLLSTLVKSRTFPAVQREYVTCRNARRQRAQTNRDLFDYGAEMAPAFGLAGTLVSIMTLGEPAAGQTVNSVLSSAVITTLYGLLLANLVFMPLGAWIERSAKREEDRREAIFKWALAHFRRSTTKADRSLKVAA